MTPNIFSSSNLNVRPIIIGAVLVVIFLGAWYGFNRARTKSSASNNTQIKIFPTEEVKPTEKVLELPTGWVTKDKVPGVELKLEKKSDKVFQPVVVMVKSTKKDEEVKPYVDDLIKGARSAFPTLRITKDTQAEKDGFYIRELTGNYINGKNRIALLMNIYIKEGDVYTVTASRDSTDTQVIKEIDSIFAKLFEAKIKK